LPLVSFLVPVHRGKLCNEAAACVWRELCRDSVPNHGSLRR